MSFLDIPDENELPEQQPVPAGQYNMQILSAERKSGISEKSGKPFDMLSIVFTVSDIPDSKPIYHTIFLPQEDDTQDRINGALRRIRYFLKAFNLPLQGFLGCIEDWPGATGQAVLALENDEEYGERNKVKRFV